MRHSFLLFTALGVATTACSGASPGELFEAPSGVATVDSGVGVDAYQAPDTGVVIPPPADSGTGPVDSAVVDSGEPDVMVPVPDSSAPGFDIFCGQGPACDDRKQFCCATPDPNDQAPPMFACVDLGGDAMNTMCANNAGVPITCDDSAQCTGSDICCGTESSTSGTTEYTHVRCEATCNYTTDQSVKRFCDPNATPDECAADGYKCQASMLLPGFYVCQ